MPSAIAIDELRVIVARALEVPPDEVGDTDHFFEELEMDSLLLLEVSSRVEKQFGVTVEDLMMASVQTLAELYELVCSLSADGSVA